MPEQITDRKSDESSSNDTTYSGVGHEITIRHDTSQDAASIHSLIPSTKCHTQAAFTSGHYLRSAALKGKLLTHIYTLKPGFERMIHIYMLFSPSEKAKLTMSIPEAGVWKTAQEGHRHIFASTAGGPRTIPLSVSALFSRPLLHRYRTRNLSISPIHVLVGGASPKVPSLFQAAHDPESTGELPGRMYPHGFLNILLASRVSYKPVCRSRR